MANDISRAIKKKLDAQTRINAQDTTPVVYGDGDTIVISDPGANLLPYVPGKNVTFGESAGKKLINAVMNIVAGDNITVSAPNPTTGAVTISSEAEELKQATSTVLGGIKAKDRTTEANEVAIDASTGRLFVSGGGGSGVFDYGLITNAVDITHDYGGLI